MEVGLVEERTCERSEPILISQSIPLPREPRPIELVADDYKKEAETCEHFTIRGYVADVRKKNAKISWPFFMLPNHKSNDYANLFPPLSVTKFRRWNCEKCQHEANASAAVVSNVDLLHIQNDEIKGNSTSLLGSTILASHSDEKTLLPGFQQLSEEKMVGEQLLAIDKSNNVSSGESRPSVCAAKKENESVIKHQTGEGFDIPKASRNICEEIRNQPSDIHTSISTIGKAFPGERTVVLTTNSLGTAHAEGAHDMIYAISTGTEVIQEMSDSRMTADPAFTVNDVAISGQKQYHDMTRHVHDIDSMELDEDCQHASDNDMDLTKYTAQSKKHAREVLIADKKVHRKKARKVRLLDDIMRSENMDVNHVMSKEVRSSECAEYAQIEDDTYSRPDTCKGKYQHIDHKSYVPDQKIQLESSKCRERYIALEMEDEGPSLMYWLKRASKKVMTHKGHNEIKPIEAIANSKPTAYASAGKCLDLIQKVSGIKGNKSKTILQRKQSEMPWASFMPQKDVMNNIRAKTSDSEFKGIKITAQTPHHGPKIQDSNHKKDTMRKKKSKTPQVANRESSQMQLLKDSFGEHVHENITDFQEQKKITKKKRTARVSKKEVLDDIPMDIVELLAKNQHQRRLMDAEAATLMMNNFSEIPRNMDRYDLSAAEGHGKLVSDAVSKDLSQRKTVSNNTVNCLRSDRNAVYSPSRGKQNSRIDLKKQDVTVASTWLPLFPECRSQPMSCAESPNYNSKNNYTQDYSWSRGRMPSHIDNTISSQNIGKHCQGQSSTLLNRNPFRIKHQNVDTDPSHRSKLCPHPLLQGKLKTVAHEMENLKIVDQEQADSSIHKRTFPPATLFAGVGNTLYPNEIIPAMHLLKLMDSATGSGASPHKSLETNKSGFIQESYFHSIDRSCELTGLSGRLGTPQAPIHPLTSECPFKGQHYGNSCKPLRPLPRVGVFGSLLQKEIAPQTNNTGTQFGFEIGHRNKLKSREINWKEKSEWPHMTTHIRMNGQNPMSRNSSYLKSCETNGKGKSECLCMAIHTTVPNVQTSISRNENTNKHSSDVYSITRDDMFQVSTNSEEAAVQTLKMETCVVNRNPADFTIVDEDNEYMIASEDQRPRCNNGQKRQKVMKLNALSGHVRS